MEKIGKGLAHAILGFSAILYLAFIGLGTLSDIGAAMVLDAMDFVATKSKLK